jgi:hypothetical protein
MWYSLVLLGGVEFQAVYWIVALKCSIACIILLWFIRDISMFSSLVREKDLSLSFCYTARKAASS